MPGNHSLRLDDDQGFGPALPQPAEDNPEQPIEAIQFGPGLLPLEDGELLAKSDGFRGEFVTSQKKRPQVSRHRSGKGNHGSILAGAAPQVTDRMVRSNRLILIPDGILMTHRVQKLRPATVVRSRLSNGVG